MKIDQLMIICLTVYLCLSNTIGQSQIPWTEYDYLELKLTHSHSFGGNKMIRLVHFSKDSCFYEFYESPDAELIKWWESEPLKKNTIGCGTFIQATMLFDSIEGREILLHHKDIIISDGFMVALEMTNGNSSAIYKIHTPQRKDENLEDFKACANLMLEMVGDSWNKWIK